MSKYYHFFSLFSHTLTQSEVIQLGSVGVHFIFVLSSDGSGDDFHQNLVKRAGRSKEVYLDCKLNYSICPHCVELR